MLAAVCCLCDVHTHALWGLPAQAAAPLVALTAAAAAVARGAKFQKLFRRAQADSALQKYEPFIVPSANFP